MARKKPQRARTLAFDLYHVEGRADVMGSATLKLFGTTASGKRGIVTVKMSPSDIGFVGERLNTIINDMSATIESARERLRGRS